MITHRTKKLHYTENERVLSDAPFFRRVTRKYYIENQAQWGSIKYGWYKRSNMAYSGCAVIAVWNTFVYFDRFTRVGAASQLSNIIGDFESFGTVFGGAFGTSVIPVFFYLKKYFKKTWISFMHGKRHYDRLGEKYDAFIVNTFNDAKNPARGLHIVCITRDSRGFSVHNSYKKTHRGNYVVTIPYRTLSEAIAHINAAPLPVAVICVKE